MKGLLLIFLISYSLAACPNLCSGHGTCSRSGSCICYPGWTEGDCSARTCPYDNPYVQPEINDEKPEGQNPNKSGDDRSYLECSGQGECDRTSGLCQCYPGYEGTACQRQSCPNGCSGHGVCTPVKFLAIDEKAQVSMNYGFYEKWKEGTTLPNIYNYDHWDQEQSFACLCDSEYEGYDCSQKKCPTGYFPTSDCDAPAQYTETIEFKVDEYTKSMAYLEYKDQLGRIWYSQHFSATKQSKDQYCNASPVGNAAAEPAVLGWEEALQTFAIGVIDVKAECKYDTSKTQYTVTLTFGSQQTGRQEQIRIITNSILTTEDPYKVSSTTVSGYHGMREEDLELCRFNNNDVFEIDTCETYATKTKDSEENCKDAKPNQNEYCPAYSTLQGDDKTDSTPKIIYSFSESLPPLPCSNNGICDQSTGLCNCFTGFYGLACTEQSALV